MNVLAKQTSQLDLDGKRSETAARTFSRVSITPKQFINRSANFQLHPERLRQLIKQKDVQIMCNFLCKEGERKRDKCMLYMEKKKRKLAGTSDKGRYVLRSYSTNTKKSHDPSYTDSLDADNFVVSKTAYQSLAKSTQTSATSDHQERSAASQKTTKRRKKLKPLQSFKRTRSLSRGCENNMPETMYPSLMGKADLEVQIKKGSLLFASTKAQSTLSKADDEDRTGSFTPVHEEKKKAIRESVVKEKIETREKHVKKKPLLYSVFDLFDRVKLDSEKTKPLGMEKTSTEGVRIVHNVENVLQRRHMHLKNQFKRLNLGGHLNEEGSEWNLTAGNSLQFEQKKKKQQRNGPS